MEFYILHPEKSKVNVLHNHSPITKTADTLLLLIDLISSVVPFMSFFCSRTQFRNSHSVVRDLDFCLFILMQVCVFWGKILNV